MKRAQCVHSFNSLLGDDQDEEDCFITGLSTDGVNIYIIDRNGYEGENNRVKVFSYEGEFKFDWRFDGPQDITVSERGVIYVTSEGEKCVKFYSNLDREENRSNGENNNLFLNQLECPFGIAQDKEGHVLVCDSKQKTVYSFDTESEELVNMLQISEWECPQYIAVNKTNDTIVVSDWAAASVHIVNSSGDILAQYGDCQNNNRDPMNIPQGVCCDEDGFIYIADCWNHRIIMLDPDGKFVNYVAKETDGLHFPQALATNSAGELLVAERHSGMIKRFELIDVPIETISPEELQQFLIAALNYKPTLLAICYRGQQYAITYDV
ncbi:tripartite motif-containing protein 3 [Lingula anatina]|uniref:Tripartite motif-containing protein 3 n=1 Tax=Lingula anatina TaxID=7574 RepID=A0A1S3JVQ2_LINAN|nr:tripartite motif-containing protein 3 [Lingula anatina]|eukprot:XP_013414490.1 tripartite motif-containing protein 3 [Lingula anatina]